MVNEVASSGTSIRCQGREIESDRETEIDIRNGDTDRVTA